MQEIEEIWTRLKAWLKTNAPQILEQLQSGASDAQIRELEEFLDVKLPEEVKASYRICNGESDDSDCWGLIDGWELLSIKNIKHEWKRWKFIVEQGSYQKQDGQDVGSNAKLGISNLFYWNPMWIPLTHDRSWNNHCLDLSPTSEGTRGQIITVWIEIPERKLIE